MTITLEELLQGKATKIKDIEYATTEAYVKPFLNRVFKYTKDLIINVKPADQISLTKDGEVNFEDIVYNRVWIQAVLPDEYAWDNHRRVISMIYALDTRKPVVKFYVGALNMACLNLCVFDPDMIFVSELKPDKPINYDFVEHAIQTTDSIHATLQALSEKTYYRDEMFDTLGHWIDNCINSKINSGSGTVKLTETMPVSVYKDLFYNEKSDYYTSEDHVDGFTVYNAFTDLITRDTKDMVNKFEKTYLIVKIMGICK